MRKYKTNRCIDIVLRIIVCCLLFMQLPVAVADEQKVTVIAGHRVFEVELADSAEKRREGLMGRTSLMPDEGMLLVMPEAQRVPIWMKNMQMSLDVIWLSGAGEVLELHTLPICRVNPCKIVRPDQPTRYVLEVGAGMFPLKVGDKVEIIALSGDSLPPVDGS